MGRARLRYWHFAGEGKGVPLSPVPETAPPQAGAKFHYGYVILVAGVITVVGCLGLARFGYNIIVPYMKQGLGLSNTQMGVIGSAGLAGYMAFTAIGGFLAAKYGPRQVISCSMLVAGLGMLLTGLAPSFPVAAACQLVVGLASAGANISVMGLASAWFARRRRAMATGVFVGGCGIGAALSGFLVPRIVGWWPHLGWRCSWFLLGGLVLLCGAVAYRFLRNSPAELGLAPIGLEPSEKAAGGTAYGSAATAGQTPGWGSVYGLRPLWYLGLVYFTFGLSYIIYGTFSSQTIVQDWGLEPALAGRVWAVAGVFAIFSGLFWGVISDRLGRLRVLAVIYALLALCNLIFALFTGAVAGLWLSAMLFGLTQTAIASIVAAICGDWVGGRLAPAALGFVAAFFAVGQASGPTLAGYLADTLASFSVPFQLGALMAAVGCIGCLLLRPPARTF